MYFEGMMLVYWTKQWFICITLADVDSSRLQALSFTAGSRLHNVRGRKKRGGEQRNLGAVIKWMDSSKVCGFWCHIFRSIKWSHLEPISFHWASETSTKQETDDLRTKWHILSESVHHGALQKKSCLTMRKLLPTHRGCGCCVWMLKSQHLHFHLTGISCWHSSDTAEQFNPCF